MRRVLAGEQLGVELNLFISRGEAAEAAAADKDGIQRIISFLVTNNRRISSHNILICCPGKRVYDKCITVKSRFIEKSI